MSLALRPSVWLAVAALSFAASPALAKKKRKTAHAHQHGHGKMSLAVDGAKLEATLELPGDAVFGFEHAPRTDADKQVVATAMKTLREAAAELLGLPAELGCQATDVNVKSSLEGDAADDDHKKKRHGKDHAKGHEEEHEKEHATRHDEGHSDVDATYKFTCAKPPAGATLAPGLFKTFPKAGRIQVQIVTPETQRATEISASSPKVEIKL